LFFLGVFFSKTEKSIDINYSFYTFDKILNLKIMKLLGLRTTIYKVSDVDKAKQWYADFLGFNPYFDEPFYVGFNVAGYELGLQPEEGVQASKKTDSVITYWGVENVSDSYQALINLGAAAHEEPTEVGGGIIVASLKDPWDNIIGLIFNPHFSIS
jgi:predicted enzyme related to lactoylglutathione lyase